MRFSLRLNSLWCNFISIRPPLLSREGWTLMLPCDMVTWSCHHDKFCQLWIFWHFCAVDGFELFQQMSKYSMLLTQLLGATIANIEVSPFYMSKHLKTAESKLYAIKSVHHPFSSASLISLLHAVQFDIAMFDIAIACRTILSVKFVCSFIFLNDPLSQTSIVFMCTNY